jgi:hypothetical protein
MRKPRIKQRKDTLTALPCHLDCIEARNGNRDISSVIPTSPPPSNDEGSGENDDVDNYLCMLGEVVFSSQYLLKEIRIRGFDSFHDGFWVTLQPRTVKFI